MLIDNGMLMFNFIDEENYIHKNSWRNHGFF